MFMSRGSLRHVDPMRARFKRAFTSPLCGDCARQYLCSYNVLKSKYVHDAALSRASRIIVKNVPPARVNCTPHALRTTLARPAEQVFEISFC